MAVGGFADGERQKLTFGRIRCAWGKADNAEALLLLAERPRTTMQVGVPQHRRIPASN